VFFVVHLAFVGIKFKVHTFLYQKYTIMQTIEVRGSGSHRHRTAPSEMPDTLKINQVKEEFQGEALCSTSRRSIFRLGDLAPLSAAQVQGNIWNAVNKRISGEGAVNHLHRNIRSNLRRLFMVVFSNLSRTSQISQEEKQRLYAAPEASSVTRRAFRAA